MKPRLLIYGDDPETGGAAASTHRLAIGLAGRGYEVHYAVTRADEGRIAERESAGVRHRFLPYDTMAAFYFSTRDRKVPAAVFREVAPDLILFADSAPDSALAAKDVAIGMGIPYLTIKHMVLPDSPWTLAPWVRGEIARTCRAARCVVAVSEASRQLLVKQFDIADATMEVVPNSRPDGYFQPRDEAARRRLRAEWGIGPDTFVVLTVARVLWLKGHELIVWLAFDLARRGMLERFRFVWVGEAADEAHLERVRTKIASWGGERFFLHLGARDDVPDCLDAADALLMMSLSEGMPLSAIEAMARGLPVVGTAVGGIPEVIGDRGAVVSSPLVSPEAAVSEAVEVLLKWRADPEATRALGAAAAIRARALFGEDRQIDHMAALIDRHLYPKGDHVSPGLPSVVADRHFPFLVPVDKERIRITGSRAEIPHLQYADGRDPYRLLLNRDEAVLLRALASASRGGDALVFGGDVGWAAWHVLAGGMTVDLMEPALAEEGVRERLLDLAARVPGMRLHVAAGGGAVLRLAERDGRRWSLAVFNRPTVVEGMLEEVEACRRVMADDAVIVFCFAAATLGVTAKALSHLRALGWRTRVHDTAEIVAVAWRGNVALPVHHPDPAVNWTRPAPLGEFEDGSADPVGSG